MAVYLDNAATSFPKPEVVYRAMDDFLRNVGASSGRGAYRKALEADEVVFGARGALAALFGIGAVERIVFTANVTEALNLAMKGWLRYGDHVVTTSMEHNAVWRCLKRLEKERDVSITVLPCAPDGALDPRDVEKAVRANTRLIVMLHASNVTGVIMPVKEVAQIARGHGIPLLVDAAQTAGVLPIDVADLGVDLLAFTGHKGLFGPTGTGGLYIGEVYIGEGLALEPLKEGGTGGDSSLESQPEYLPDRFEAGTLNVVGIAGLGAGVRFLLQEGTDSVRERERRLTAYALERLGEVPNIRVYGPRDATRQVGVISFNVAGVAPEEVAYTLDQDHGIMVRAGLHCAPLAHRTIGTIHTGGTVRIGIGLFNTEEDIDRLIVALHAISKKAG